MYTEVYKAMSKEQVIEHAREMSSKRPTDPSKISFSSDCFEVVGYRVYFIILKPNGWCDMGGSTMFDKRFSTGLEAEKAAHSNEVVKTKENITIRLKWY